MQLCISSDELCHGIDPSVWTYKREPSLSSAPSLNSTATLISLPHPSSPLHQSGTVGTYHMPQDSTGVPRGNLQFCLGWYCYKPHIMHSFLPQSYCVLIILYFCDRDQEKFVVLCLQLLNTHLSLALTGGMTQAVLGGEVTPLRELLFRY